LTTLSAIGTPRTSSWSRTTSSGASAGAALATAVPVVPLMMRTSSSIDGYATRRLNMKRSTCASGSG
jgi:hypothetical protein